VPISANRWMSRGQLGGPLLPYSRISRPDPLLFLSSCSSVVITRLSGPRNLGLNQRKSKQLRVLDMRFVGPLLDLTVSEQQRNSDTAEDPEL
jgi:hypothetical protein